MGPVRAKSALAPSSRNRCWRQARPPASSGHTRLAREAQPINSSPRPIVWVPARWFIYSRLDGRWRPVRADGRAGEDGVAGEARVGQPPEPQGRACCWGFCCDFSGLKDCRFTSKPTSVHFSEVQALQTRDPTPHPRPIHPPTTLTPIHDPYTPPTTHTPHSPSRPLEVFFFP